MSWARLEGVTHGMKTRTSLFRNDCLVWDFGGFSCLTGEVVVASEADRAASEEDLLPLRAEWVRVPAEVDREPLSFSSTTGFSPAGMSVEADGLGVALVVVAVVVVVVVGCGAGSGPGCCWVGGWSGGEASEGSRTGCLGSEWGASSTLVTGCSVCFPFWIKMSGKWYYRAEKGGRTGFVDSLDSEAIGLHVQRRTGRPPKTTGDGWGSEGGRRGRRIHGGGDSHGNKTKV